VGVDLVGACSVFVHVTERGSFTDGAAAARVPQSVASRRVAALEEHFGERLFDRTGRRPSLTAFGRDMLPAARRLVHLADDLQQDAEQARLRPLTLAVPQVCGTRTLAALDAAATRQGSPVKFREAPPAERLAMAQSGQVRAAITAVPPGDAVWTVPLGVAGRDGAATVGFRLASLRPSRSAAGLRRLWLQPEDDVPHVRDAAERAGHRAGLLPAQVAVAVSLTSAVSAALRTSDLLLCSRMQADALDLRWRPTREPVLARGYAVQAALPADTQRVTGRLAPQVAACLGAADTGAGPA